MSTPTGETKKKNAEESPTKKGLRRFFKIAIVLIVAAFLYLTVRRSIDELRGKEEFLSVLAERWPWLVVALFVSIVAMFPAGIAWYQALRSFRQTVPWLPALDAYFLGHLGKYVPGKAMVLIMRVGRLQPLGVGLRPAIVSVFVETLTMLCAGAVLGALLLVLLEVPVWLKITALACVPVGLLFLTPHFFRIGLTIVAKSKIGRMPPEIPKAFTAWFMCRTTAWMLLGWILQGTVGWLAMLALTDQPSLMTMNAWLSITAAVCLGAVAGFFSMLPSGAIVRELVITWLLTPLVDQPTALAGAILLRLVNLLGELILISIMSGWNRVARKTVNGNKST